MSGAWGHRIVRDDKGTLHFAAVRFRPFEDKISGITEIWNSGKTIDDLRKLVHELELACERAIIDLKDGIDPDAVEDEYDEDDD